MKLIAIVFFSEDVLIQVCQKRAAETLHSEQALNNTVPQCIDDWTIFMYSHGDVKVWNSSKSLYQVSSVAE